MKSNRRFTIACQVRKVLVMKKLILSLAIGHAALATPAYSQESHVITARTTATPAVERAATAAADAAADAAINGVAVDAAAEPTGPYPEYADGLVALPTDYPHRAAALKQEGQTWYRLEVDPRGKPIRCDVIESSGYDLLDDATCPAVMRAINASPAEPVEGVTENSTYDGYLFWSVQEPEFSTSEIELTFRVNEYGGVENCNIVKMAGNPPTNFKRAPCPTEFGPYRDAEGKPVTRDIRIKLVTDVTDPGVIADK